MNRSEFDKLMKVTPLTQMVNITEVRNQSDRVLLVGSSGGTRFTLSIKEGSLELEVYEYLSLIKELRGQSLPTSEVVPDQLHPDLCDFEFCKVLTEKGLKLNFSNLISEKIAV